VISADSRQVYRRLNLGAGKMSLSDMSGIKHHLIDIVDAGVSFNLFQYQSHALKAITDVFRRQRQPIVVGGTGLYVDCIADGYMLVPVKEDPSLRRELEKLDRGALIEIVRAEQEDSLPLLQHAAERRLIRAIEIIRSGVRYSDTRQQQKLYDNLMVGV